MLLEVMKRDLLKTEALFILSLTLLLLNDFYLKQAFHNEITGKLSDFCGLYVFVVFWSSILPKHKKTIFWVTGLLFVLWKSPGSQLIIDFFSINLFTINRVVDITDLSALLVLPLAYNSTLLKLNLSFKSSLIAVVSLFAFAATSRYITQTFENPQYILLKQNNLKFSENYKVCNVGENCLIRVDQVELDNFPVMEDDFQRTLVQRELPRRVIYEAYMFASADSVTLEAIIDSLIIPGKFKLNFSDSSFIDSISFVNSIMDGKYLRKSKSGKVLIRGQYKSGLEDSVWTYYNEETSENEIVYYHLGEKLKKELVKGDKVVNTENILTRERYITRKYFEICILLVLIIGVLIFIKSQEIKDSDLKWTWKLPIILLMPIAIIFLKELITLTVLAPRRYDIIEAFFEYFLMYVFLGIVLFVIAFLGGFKRKNALVLYPAFIVLLTTFFTELIFTIKLFNA
jgi:uncharacterized integral membrane protein